MEGSENERGGFGKMNYGCEHYRRRCKIRAPCCNRIFDCRYCHIEAMSKLSDPSEWHELARNAIKQVVCSVCGREQPVARICTNCGVNMGEYFCDICKLYDDDIQKGHFHCTDCGICRVGGRENFFHCEKCGTCYALHLRDRHVCVENSMRHNCPICCEVCFVCPASDIKKQEKVCDFSYTIKPCLCKYLFDSRKGTTIMKCGHTIHCECYNKMVKHRVRCPICSGLLVDVPGP